MAKPPEQLPLFDLSTAPHAGEVGASGASARSGTAPCGADVRAPGAIAEATLSRDGTPPGSADGAPERAGVRARRPGRKRAGRQLDLALPERRRIEVIEGGGGGTGHRRARLVALDGGATPERPLPTRDEITGALLQGLADLVAGRISVAAAAAIREAAEHALRQLDAAERDPHATPRFVRAARALQELLPGR